MGLNQIVGDTQTEFVGPAEAVLSESIALDRRAAEVFDGFSPVLPDAFSAKEEPSEAVFGFRESLVRSETNTFLHDPLHLYRTYADKVVSLDEAMASVTPGTRLMMGEFVGAGEPARCIEWLLDRRVGDLTLITVTPGVRGRFLMGRLFEQGQISELISTHAASSPESSDAYLSGQLKVRQFFPMGTWAEKVRAGAMGLGGVLVPVGVGILDQPGLFSDLDEPKRTLELHGRTFFVEEALRAQVSIIKGWRADPLGNVEFRQGIVEDLPVADGLADAVISNGVFNLCADKRRVFTEIMRVLRPGGRLQFADIANGKEVPAGALRNIDLWTD